MAKYVNHPSGGRMLVSDDTPDMIDDELFEPSITNKTLESIDELKQDKTLSFISMVLHCGELLVPIRVNKMISTEKTLRLKCFVLLEDFLTLVENKEQVISFVEIEAEQKTFKIGSGWKLIKAKTKEIDASYVIADLLLGVHN
jgi:hypothetical protein